MEHYVSKPFCLDQLIETILLIPKAQNRNTGRADEAKPVTGSGETVLDKEDG